MAAQNDSLGLPTASACRGSVFEYAQRLQLLASAAGAVKLL
jgi:hypothetical protein